MERIRLPMTDVEEMSTLGSSASRDLSFLAKARAGIAAMIAIDVFMVEIVEGNTIMFEDLIIMLLVMMR